MRVRSVSAGDRSRIDILPMQLVTVTERPGTGRVADDGVLVARPFELRLRLGDWIRTNGLVLPEHAFCS